MISALPAALAGIAWFLFITHTTLSVPALMGAIMCMDVATSNSILVVSFATEKLNARIVMSKCGPCLISHQCSSERKVSPLYLSSPAKS